MARPVMLNDEDLKLLQGMLDKSRREVVSTSSRRVVIPEDLPAPETFIVKTPLTGIPGMTGVIPTYAECQVYQLDGVSGSLIYSGFTRRVYNFAINATPNARLVLATKDKYGTWFIADTEGAEDSGETGTGTGPEIACVAITVIESDIRCESGSLNLYQRVLTINSNDVGCLTKSTSAWTLIGSEGCCNCPSGCTDITIIESDIQCVFGVLKLYNRVVTIGLDANGCLTKSAGSWVFASNEGCCLCPPDTGTGFDTTGTGFGNVGTGTGGNGVIATGCCPSSLIPLLLHVTVTNKTGGCSCVPDSFTIEYTGSSIWTSPSLCTGPNITLACFGTTWSFQNASVGTGVLISSNCNPFQLVFDVTGDPITCTGTWRATITE